MMLYNSLLVSNRHCGTDDSTAYSQSVSPLSEVTHWNQQDRLSLPTLGPALSDLR